MYSKYIHIYLWVSLVYEYIHTYITTLLFMFVSRVITSQQKIIESMRVRSDHSIEYKKKKLNVCAL